MVLKTWQQTDYDLAPWHLRLRWWFAARGEPLDHEEVLAAGRSAATRMGELLGGVVAEQMASQHAVDVEEQAQEHRVDEAGVELLLDLGVARGHEAELDVGVVFPDVGLVLDPPALLEHTHPAPGSLLRWKLWLTTVQCWSRMAQRSASLSFELAE